jgi:hypothetical protein
VARHIFQACPVWIYTQSNMTQALYKFCTINTTKSSSAYPREYFQIKRS